MRIPTYDPYGTLSPLLRNVDQKIVKSAPVAPLDAWRTPQPRDHLLIYKAGRAPGMHGTTARKATPSGGVGGFRGSPRARADPGTGSGHGEGDGAYSTHGRAWRRRLRRVDHAPRLPSIDAVEGENAKVAGRGARHVRAVLPHPCASLLRGPASQVMAVVPHAS